MSFAHPPAPGWDRSEIERRDRALMALMGSKNPTPAIYPGASLIPPAAQRIADRETEWRRLGFDQNPDGSWTDKSSEALQARQHYKLATFVSRYAPQVPVASVVGVDVVLNPAVPEDTLALLDLPDDDAVRGDYPMASGLLDYFPLACAEVAKVSKIGNDQHNPGQPMHWARDKSVDHADKVMRHLVDRGRFDGRGVRHTARAAWRIMAMLQTEMEQALGKNQSRASIGQAPPQA